MDSSLISRAVQAFALGQGEVVISRGSRGAVGQVWRLTLGVRVYALKQVPTGSPPPRVEVDAELSMAKRAVAAGVLLPASIPARDGEYVVMLPEGGWLRLYDWMDLEPVDLGVNAKALGVLLARLHRSGSPSHREPDGSSPLPWYEVPPQPEAWRTLVAASAAAGASWSTRLAAAVDSLPRLYELLSGADPAKMRTCHRDLHPGNVLASRGGELVVVDWGDIGPAVPARELAGALMALFHDGHPDLASMRQAYQAYILAGGPARLRSTTDFTMSISTQLNFLHRQVQIALDPQAQASSRTWAELEIDEGLRILPTPELLTRVLDAVAGHRRTPPPGVIG